MTVVTDIIAARSVADKFEQDGYIVTIEPEVSLIPFDIYGYRPDLLAVKGDEKVIVEIKRSRSKVNSDLYLRVAEAVSRHPGWSFKLVTLPEDFEKKSFRNFARLDQIQRTIDKVDKFLKRPGSEEFVIFTLWNAYVYALLLRIEDNSDPKNWRSDLSILNTAYSQGVINFEELNKAKRFLEFRNFAAHNVDLETSRLEIMEFLQQTKKLVTEIGN